MKEKMRFLAPSIKEIVRANPTATILYRMKDSNLWATSTKYWAKLTKKRNSITQGPQSNTLSARRNN